MKERKNNANPLSSFDLRLSNITSFDLKGWGIIMIKKTHLKTFGMSALSLFLSVSLLPITNFSSFVQAVEDTTIESPTLGDTITWDCIYFGNYPQSEITKEIDADTYQLLQASSDWNNNNILTINTGTYKRIKKEDAISTSTAYHWGKDNTYHYFKFEPIKWRVIEVNGTSAYMISDVALDTQKYNLEAKEVTWNNSTLRSWLNGYTASENQPAIDYSLNNFADTAFSGSEKDSIVSANNDKVTILSEEDLKNNKVYGLDTPNNRSCKASSYALARGAHEDISGTCNYWTSTNGNSNLTAKFAQPSGEIYTKGYSVVYAGNAIRTAVTISLEKTDNYRYAGTISSDGTVTDPVVTTTPVSTPTVTPATTPAITATAPAFTSSPTTPVTTMPMETPNVITMVPSVAPTQTTVATTTVPVKTIAPTAILTAAPTGSTTTTIPTKEATTTAPTPTETAVTTTPVNIRIKKGSVYSHTASNGTYRVTKINKTTAKDGTIGTVAFIKPIRKNKTSASIPATVTIKKCKLKVTIIEKNAFKNNKKLKQVVIGKNITKIKENAFKGCKKLSKITIRTTKLTKKNLGKNAFKQINGKAIIRVPSKKVTSYKKWLKATGIGKSVVFKKLK